MHSYWSTNKNFIAHDLAPDATSLNNLQYRTGSSDTSYTITEPKNQLENKNGRSSSRKSTAVSHIKEAQQQHPPAQSSVSTSLLPVMALRMSRPNGYDLSDPSPTASVSNFGYCRLYLNTIHLTSCFKLVLEQLRTLLIDQHSASLSGLPYLSPTKSYRH